MSLPPLKAIQSFEQVARFGNVARAAEQLNLTPSAVSHQIANLEALIGRPLFLRNARGVTLTPAGEQYLRDVTGVLQSLALATQRAGNDISADSLRLHSAPSFGLLWLLPRLERFRESHPDIQINRRARTNRCTSAVTRSISISAMATPTGQAWRYEPFATSTWPYWHRLRCWQATR